ncbi:MAG: hypothetical protein IKE38_03760 [Erysipelotrichaceae bacterium]|nr:hypothetical protein [Erysipelotrichaceae bacterium]
MQTKKAIRLLSLVYTIIAALTVILALFAIRTDENAAAMAARLGFCAMGNYDPKILVAMFYGIEALIYLWNSWLLGRIANDKSNGTLMLALSILGVGSGAYSLLSGFNINSLLSLIMSAIIIALIIKYRRDKSMEELRAFMETEDYMSDDDDEEEIK